MLAAYADFQIRTGAFAILHSHLNQLADSRLIQMGEGILLQKPLVVLVLKV